MNYLVGQRGQTLVEAVISLTVVIVIITAVVIAVVTALSATNNNSNQNSALNFAQEGLSTLKDASSNFVSFQSTYPTGNYCMADDNIIDPTTTDCPSTGTNITGNTGTYLRTVYVGQTGNNSQSAPKCSAGAYISSTVSWTDSKCNASTPNCHNVILESCVSNQNVLPGL